MARDSKRRRKKLSANVVTQRPWGLVKNPYRPIEVLSADQIEQIHNTYESLEILAEILHPQEFAPAHQGTGWEAFGRDASRERSEP